MYKIRNLIMCAFSLLVVQQLNAVIFVNKTRKTVDIQIYPKIPGFPLEQMLSMVYLKAELLVGLSNKAFYPGKIYSVTALYRGVSSNDIETLYPDQTPELEDLLLQLPLAEITIVPTDNPQVVKFVVPEIKALKEQILREHQMKVKPRIQEAVPQLPSGVTGIATEYCAP